jgi:hypothetical protein
MNLVDPCNKCKEWDAEFVVKDFTSPLAVRVCNGCVAATIEKVLDGSSADTCLVTKTVQTPLNQKETPK